MYGCDQYVDHLSCPGIPQYAVRRQTVPPIFTSSAPFQPIRALVHQICACVLLCLGPLARKLQNTFKQGYYIIFYPPIPVNVMITYS